MTTSNYNKKIIGMRKLTNDNMKYTERRMNQVLNKAYNDISEKLNLMKRDSMSYSYYNLKKKSIKKTIDSMVKNIGDNTMLGIKNNTEDITDVYSKLSKKHGRDYGIDGIDFDKIFNTVPRLATENCINRLWGGENFSKRIWKMNNYANNSINGIIQSGISRGESAISMSKRLKQFIINPDTTPKTSWTTGVKKSITGRGTINYNALRLARTEINNSYREALIINNQKNPITKGIKWNLSNSHTIPDVCDMFAGADSFGMGAGVYPAQQAPIDHPNGFCYITEILRPVKEWKEQKPTPLVRKLSKKHLLSKLPKKDLNDSQINNAYKMFTNTFKFINKEKKT